MSTLNFAPPSLPVSKQLQSLLSQYCQNTFPSEETKTTSSTITINFRDKSYSAEEGGYHPVEISLNIKEDHTLDILYITDFAYMGNYYPELERCIDFDFGNQVVFTVATGWQSIRSEGIDELYKMWEQNFLHYIDINCFDEIVASQPR
jgi:hypothetical protein